MLNRSIMTVILLFLLWLPSAVAVAVAQAPAVGLNRNAPNARGLIAWWKPVPGFTGGRYWYDLLGRSHGVLTNTGTASATSGWAVSSQPTSFKLPGEVRFDGTDDVVVIPYGAHLEPPTATTIMLWVKARGTWGASAQPYGLMDAGGSLYRTIGVNGSGFISVYIATDNGDVHIDPGSTTLAVNRWYHIAAAYSQATGLVLYVDCQVDTVEPIHGNLVPVGSGGLTWIGAHRAAAGSYLTGAMQDVRIYDRALSTQDVCSVMAEAAQGEPKLLPPTLLSALLGSVPVAGNTGSFLPWFYPQ